MTPWDRLQGMLPVLLHFVWVADDVQCIVITRVCVSVCLSAAACPHYWADLQSVHGLRCYGNITRTRNVGEYMLDVTAMPLHIRCIVNSFICSAVNSFVYVLLTCCKYIHSCHVAFYLPSAGPWSCCCSVSRLEVVWGGPTWLCSFLCLFCGVLFLCSRWMFVFVVMAALCNRAGHYIFALWFLMVALWIAQIIIFCPVVSSSFFSSPNLRCRMVWP